MGVKPEDIWDHPSNAALRKQRPNQEILAPGDVLFVPVVKPKWLPVAVGETNAFVATVPTVTVDLRLTQDDGDGNNALAGMTYVIHGLPSGDVDGTFGSDASISLQVPVNVREVTLFVSELQATYPIVLGRIDPVDTDSGLRQRLAHLGYIDDSTGSFPVDDAVCAFQRDRQIDTSGTVDAATAQALTDAHGS
jgi:hypothetical protein